MAKPKKKPVRKTPRQSLKERESQEQTGSAKARKPITRAQRKRRREKLIWAAVAATLTVGLVYWIVSSQMAKADMKAALTAGTCRVDAETDGGATNQHANEVAFEVNPPAGGVHLPQSTNPGNFSSGTVPPDGQIVHALEHGDIAIWYKPSLTDAEVKTLRDIYDNDDSNDVLLVPRESLPVKVAATAWHQRLLCDQVEEPALTRFIESYQDEGPEGFTD